MLEFFDRLRPASWAILPQRRAEVDTHLSSDDDLRPEHLSVDRLAAWRDRLLASR